VGRPLRVEPVQGLQDLRMERLGRQQQAPGAGEELQADVPAHGGAKLLVEHPQEEPGALLLAGAGERPRHADEVVEVGRVLGEGGQPLLLDGVEVALREMVLRVARDRHGGSERSWKIPDLLSRARWKLTNLDSDTSFRLTGGIWPRRVVGACR